MKISKSLQGRIPSNFKLLEKYQFKKKKIYHNKEIKNTINLNRNIKFKTYNQFYGEEKAKEIKGKISNSLKNRTWEEKFGKEKSIEMKKLRKEKLSREPTQKPSEWITSLKGRTYEEIYGIEKAKQIKEKLRKSRIGITWEQRYGKERAEILRENQSKRNKLHKNPMLGRFGEKNHRWRGGTSFEPYTLDFSRRFKEMIKERDNYSCVVCNLFEDDCIKLYKQNLSIHHIDYDKKNSFPQNCVCLCKKCHTITNNNRQHWKSFFQSLLNERYNYEYTMDQKIVLDFRGKSNT